MSTAPVILIKDVYKTFRRKIHALRGVSMEVHEGQIFGLLGPNGAGKSTLVKILMTVVRANRLSGTLLGRPVGHKPTLKYVGYLPEHHRFPKYLTANQVLKHFAALSGVGRHDRRRRCGEMLDLVGMGKWGRERVGGFSKGMLQRIGIAQALMNNPRLLVLDEPTDGVDPMGRREIRDLLVRLRSEGCTIFINSHLLSELEMVCDRVAILVKGQVAMEGTIDELTADSRRYEIITSGPVAADVFKDLGAWKRTDGRTQFKLPQAEPADVQIVIDRLRAGGTTIESLLPVRESLEDLFMRAVEETGEDAATPGAVTGRQPKVRKP